MSIFLPPIDILRPISLVRSVTDTYIIFMIPMPPTKSEMPAITESKIVRISEVEVTLVSNSFCDRTLKSFSSPALRLCFTRKNLFN